MLYPQQNDLRDLLDLSGLWDFQLDPDDHGRQRNWSQGLPSPRPIAVPASWNEQFEDTRDYLGPAWYFYRFQISPTWEGKRLFLRFGSANYAAQVWLNDQFLGEHQGGHLPFTFDITASAHFNRANRLAVRLENLLTPQRVPPGNVDLDGLATLTSPYPPTNFDFFPYAGLHRPVLLYSTPQTYIEDVTVITDIENVDGLAQIHLKAIQEAGQAEIRLDGEKASVSTEVDLVSGQAESTLRLEQARFWSPADPYLYNLEVVLKDKRRITDRYRLDVGIRTIQVQSDQLLLNGHPIFLRGFARHEDFPIHGRGLDLPVLVKDYSLLQWLGANSYRTSHYPYSEEALALADRLGLLVIAETPAVGLFFEGAKDDLQARLAQCQQQLRELIARDKNHPSVILWSLANEPLPAGLSGNIDEQALEANTTGTKFLSTLLDLAHSLDPTRPATLAAMTACPAEWLALCDVVCLNRYWGWYTQCGQPQQGAALLEQELDSLHETLHKPIIVSEFGADAIAGAHGNPPEMWTEEYQAELLCQYLDVIERKPYVVGAHIWNLTDFKTSQSTGRPGGLNLKGVFTRERRPKLAAHSLRQRWGNQSAQVPAAPAVVETPEPQPEAKAGGMLALLQTALARLEGKHLGADAAIRFDFGTDGIYRLVISQGHGRLEIGDGPAVSSVRMRASDAEKIFQGRMNPIIAFTTGRIKISGDLKPLKVLQDLVKP